MCLNTLFERFGSDKGRVLYSAVWNNEPRPDLANNYAPFYQKKFAPLRNRHVTLLEMGLTLGERPDVAPSLAAWRHYFPDATLVGFDIVDMRHHQKDGYTILHGDQSRVEDLERLIPFGPYDIIIDDADHVSEDQIRAFLTLWDSVKPGGFYIIEDLSIGGPSPWHMQDNAATCAFLNFSDFNVEYFVNQHGNHQLACVTKGRE